jgi:hypothetical protein
LTILGTAIYLYALSAKEAPSNSLVPKNINLRFTLDHQSYPSYQNTNSLSSGSGSDDEPNAINVLAVEGLKHLPHVLVVSLEPNSLFAFDYMVYSHLEEKVSPTGQQEPVENAAG